MPAAVVLDCSAALSWFMPDEDEPVTRELQAVVTDQGAVVPMLWPLELANALVFAVRSRRINAAQRATALDALGQLPVEIDTETLTNVWTETLALADKLRLTIYDACYLELAQRRRLPLATLDRDLRAAAKKLGVPLLN